MLGETKTTLSIIEKTLPPPLVLSTFTIAAWLIGYTPDLLDEWLDLSSLPSAIISSARVVFVIAAIGLALWVVMKVYSYVSKHKTRSKIKICYSDLDDAELALLYLCRTYIGGIVRMNDQSGPVQRLREKGLITFYSSGGFVVDQSPFQSYWLTDLGKKFEIEIRDKLNEKFADHQKFKKFVEPYIEGTIELETTPSY